MRLLRLAPLVCLCLALMLAIAGPRADAAEPPKPEDFVAGYAAFLRGDYAAALSLWRPLAERGDIDAAFNLGTLYDNGYGVAADPEAASAWYKRAAERKFAPPKRSSRSRSPMIAVSA
jgi:TPR repeat protein